MNGFETSHKRREGIVTSPAGLLFRDFRRSHRMTEISYSGYRFPPEIIQQAIWLWWLFAYFVVITIGKLYLSPHQPRGERTLLVWYFAVRQA